MVQLKKSTFKTLCIALFCKLKLHLSNFLRILMQLYNSDLFLLGEASSFSGQANQVQQKNNLLQCLADLTINPLPGYS